MIRVYDIVKGLKIFERNKVPLEVKVLGIATYIQTSSVRAARILSEIHPVSSLKRRYRLQQRRRKGKQ